MIQEISIEKILPNPEQPRTAFDEDELSGLAESVREHGIIQAISLEACEDGETYLLEDGERRWRAARLAGLVTIPAMVHPPRNGSGARIRLERALVANIQRADMNAIEEARAFRRLQEEFGLTQIEIGHRLGKGVSGQAYVHNRLVLLDLEPEIQAFIAAGKFHQDSNVARALLKIPDSAARVKLVEMLVQRKSSIQASIHAARRVQLALQTQDEKTLTEVLAPAFTHARTKPDRKRYDALAHTGHLPPWPLFVTSIQGACNRCVWADAANANICGECPMVDLVNTVNEEMHHV